MKGSGSCTGYCGLTYLFFLTRWRFTSWTADRLYDWRTFDSAGWLYKTTLHQFIIKLLPLYWSKECIQHLNICKTTQIICFSIKKHVRLILMLTEGTGFSRLEKEKCNIQEHNSNLLELLRLGTPEPKACVAVLFTSFTPSDSSSSDRLWAPATAIDAPTTGSPACICTATT